MATEEITREDIDALVRRVGEAADAYIRGDMDTYLRHIHHAEDYTLMSPFGGDVVHGFDPSPEQLAATSEFFRAGEAELEVVATYASGDLVVLVVIERQHGEVGGLPDQDWSLRVTMVFRRAGGQWQQVHRHADALVHPIDLDQLSVLARG